MESNAGRVIEIIEGILGLKTGSVCMEQTLEELEIDSIRFIQWVVQCETTFEIQFEDEKLLMELFPTVASFATYVCSRI